MSAADNFLRGLKMMDDMETNRVRREREESEYQYLQDQRKYGQVANKVDYLTSKYGDNYEAMAADPAFVEIANDAAFESGFRSADGNKFKLKGFRKNPQSGAMIAYGDTVDDTGNIVKANVPITKNRTGDPKDEILQMPAKDWVAQANNMLTNWEGYREYNDTRKKQQARDEFVNQYADYQGSQQPAPEAPRTPFHGQSAQGQVPSAQPPAPTANTPSAPAPVVESTPAAPAAFDPAAKLQSANSGKNVVQRFQDWRKDGGAKNVASIFAELTADQPSPQGQVLLREVQSNPVKYAKLLTGNPEAVMKALGPEKFEQVRSYLAANVPPDSEPSKPLSEVKNWLPGRKNVKDNGTKLNRDLAALQDKLPEGSKPIAETSEKTQKALTTASKQMPNTPEGKKQVAKEGQAALQTITEMRPGARVPAKLKKAALKLWAMNPEAMPLEVVDRLITTGRLTKRDMSHVRSGDDIVSFDEAGNVVNVYKGAPSVQDALKAENDRMKRLDSQRKEQYKRNTDYVGLQSQALFDQGKVDTEVYPTKEALEAEVRATIANNPDELAKAGFPANLEDMSEPQLNYIINTISQQRKGDAKGGIFSREVDTTQQLDMQNMPTTVVGPDGQNYNASDWVSHAAKYGIVLTTPEELNNYMHKALNRGK